MIVLSEDSPRLSPSPSAASVKSVTEAARLADCRIYYIPQEEICASVADALAYVPSIRLLDLDTHSRGRVVVRQLVKLRHHRVSRQGFPFGREYRVFLYRREILGFGYYWEGDDPLKPLLPEEQAIVLAQAQEAARRVGSPFIAVDIGQTESGDWIVIETGDAQFSGASQIPLLALWHAISCIGS